MQLIQTLKQKNTDQQCAWDPFIEYESPMGDILWKHSLEAYFYADNTQIYLGFKTIDKNVSITTTKNARVDGKKIT